MQTLLPQKANGKNHNVFGFIPPSVFPPSPSLSEYTYQFESRKFLGLNHDSRNLA